jgi:hypothetical protein
VPSDSVPVIDDVQDKECEEGGGIDQHDIPVEGKNRAEP